MVFFSSIFSLLVKRRSLLLWVAFSLSLLVVKLGEWFVVRSLEANWTSVRQEKSDAMISFVQKTFHSYQWETLQSAERIAASRELVREVSLGSNQKRLFEILQHVESGSEMSVEVYDHRGNLLAWWGRTAGLQQSLVDVQRKMSFVSSGSVYSYLIVVVPVLEKETVVGFAVVHRLFDVNYPFSNRFIRSEAFTQTFPQQLGVSASYDFSHFQGSGLVGKTETAQTKKRGVIPIPLAGITGEIIGYVFVEETVLAKSIDEVHDAAGRLVSILLILLSLVIVFVLVKFFHRSPRFLIRIVGISIATWVMRYAWLWLGFPSDFFSVGIFDPHHFASPFGFGIAKSLGELFLTCAALFGNTAYIGYQLLPRLVGHGHDERLGTPFERAAAVLTISILAVSLFLVHRGFTAALRSAVFDSTLQYSEPTEVLPNVELAFMEVSVLLIALAFVAAAMCIIAGGYRLSKGWFRSLFGRCSFLFIVFSGIGILFGVFHPSPLVGQLPRFLIFTGMFTLVVYFLRRLGDQNGSGTRETLFGVRGTVLWFAAAAVILIFQLDDQVHQRERRNIETLAAELSQPVDAWLTFVLEQALGEMSGEESVQTLVSGHAERWQKLAFTQWAKSILSKEGYTCGVSFRDAEGHLISNFRIGVRQMESFLLQSGRSPRAPIMVVEQESPFGRRKVYSGSKIIRRTDGRVLGSVEVVISAGERTLFRGEAPPILRSYEREEREQYLRTLIISEFVDGKLTYTTGDDIPRELQISSDMLEKFWVDEQRGMNRYETLYFRTDTPAERGVTLAIGWKRVDWRWHLFDFLRYALFYLLVVFFAAIVILIAVSMRGYRLRLSFRNKLLIAFFIVSLVPVLLLTFYNREITIERANQSFVERLTAETATLRDHLLMDIRSAYGSDSLTLQSVQDDWCEDIASEIGTDFSIYVDAEEHASSKPELFEAEILDSRLSGNAYMHTVLQAENFYVENRAIGNYDYLVGYRPLIAPSGTIVGVLAVPILYRQLEVAEDLARRNVLLFGAYALVMLLALVVGAIFAQQMFSPIRQLIVATRRIAAGDLDFHLPATRTDEMGELHQAFNTMTADLKRNREELIKAERELAWKEMAKQVAHEIKNPLTPIKLSIQHLRQAFRDKNKNFRDLLEQVTATVIEQIDALSRIASQFAHFARMPERREEDVDLDEVLAEAAKLFEELKEVHINFRHSRHRLLVRADREELRRAFINIIRNAVQAMGERGRITITSKADKDAFGVLIKDTGPGIPEQIRHRLFEPNFSTKSEGMGLGLAIVKKTIDDLHGTIHIDSKAGKGTTVRIGLPKK